MQITHEEYDGSDQAQLQTAFHESGHCLIAEVIAAPVTSLSIVRDGDRLGGFRGGNSSATGDLYYHHMAMMAFAGMIAEEIHTGKSIKSLSHGDAKWYRTVEAAKGRDFTTRSYHEARKHLTDNWPIVTRLANELFKKRKLSGEEIRKVLNSKLK